ncbi:MAG: TolC family protein [Hydrogenophilaceae bacterium]|nr:TolC family protein [Hydrogenophilaceae bacterium]
MRLPEISLFVIAASLALPAGLAHAQTINLDQAIQLSLTADPRIREREYLVEAARGLLSEVKGNHGWRINANAFIGLSPAVEGGFYQGGATTCTPPCTPRSDSNDWNGLSDWTHLEFALIKPLYTFGKIDEYGKAAQGNIEIKRGEVQQTKAETIFDTKRAYYGYLTSRDIRLFLEDMQGRLLQAISRAESALKEESGEVTLSDLYSLQTAKGLIGKYVHQAKAVETISLDGLKVLTGVGLKAPLSVADVKLEPVSFPSIELPDLQAKALSDRPEMQQLEAGLKSRRALLAARKAEIMPDIYAGVVGTYSYASQRDKLENPHVYDPFNGGGLTPVLGVKWDAVFDVASARVSQAQAELEALNQKRLFALAGIPFEVGEAYANARANYEAQKELAEGAASARRWVIASLADFSAGLEKGDRLAEAIKSYVLAQTEYLRTVNDFNMNVAQLSKLTGEQK